MTSSMAQHPFRDACIDAACQMLDNPVSEPLTVPITGRNVYAMRWFVGWLVTDMTIKYGFCCRNLPDVCMRLKHD